MTNTSINQNNKLYDYILQEDLWDKEINDLDDIMLDIFNGIKNEVNFAINKNKICQFCQNMKNHDKNKSNHCEQCYCGLKVGHALILFEILNELCDNEKENVFEK